MRLETSYTVATSYIAIYIYIYIYIYILIFTANRNQKSDGLRWNHSQ